MIPGISSAQQMLDVVNHTPEGVGTGLKLKLFLATYSVGYLWHVFRPAKSRPNPITRALVVAGLQISLILLTFSTAYSYHVLSTGIIHCAFPGCVGSTFFDSHHDYHTPTDGLIALVFDPTPFWTNYFFLSVVTAFAFSILVPSIKFAMRWRELP